MSAAVAIEPCWNQVGVWGGGDCPELARHVHCRNCEVFSRAAGQALDRELPADYRDAAAKHFAQPIDVKDPLTQSAILFRLHTEWFALTTSSLVEVSERRDIHPLPHRRGGMVLGLVNIRGELMVCVSLAALLGLSAPTAPPKSTTGLTTERLLVIREGGERLVFPVSEIHGIHRFSSSVVLPLPETVQRAPSRYSTGVLFWQKKSVGCLNAPLVFQTLNRSLG